MNESFAITDQIDSSACKVPRKRRLTAGAQSLFAFMALGILAQGLGLADTVGVLLNPATGMLNPLQSMSITASVAGTPTKTVTWSLSPAVGSLATSANSSVYTAPATISASQVVTITATSTADPTKKASTVISLVPPVAISLNVTSGTLRPSQTQSLSATVTGTTNAAVTWSLSPAVGSLATSANSSVYTAPATIGAAQTVTVTATTVATPSKTASAVISLVPPLAISLNATSGTLSPFQTQSLTATVTGSSNTAVTWSLSPAVGTLVTAGNTTVYTAPATISSAQTVTVTATTVATPSKKASTVISLVPPLAISLNSTSGTLNASQTQSLTATVTGSSNTAVTWSLSPAVGSLTTTGNTTVYRAPSTISSAQTVTVTATTVAAPSKTASAVVSLVPLLAISLNSTSGTLNASQTQSLTATVTGSSNTAVTWSLSPAVGSLTTSGTIAVYTAPAIINSGQTVTITATTMATPVKTASALISLVSLASVSLMPAAVTLGPSATQQFTGTVSGVTNTALTWSLSPAIGTISSAGLFTAPSSISAQQTVTLTAKSVATQASSATSTLTLSPATVVVNPANITLTDGQTQQFSAAVTGVSNTSVNWSVSPAVGSITAGGLYSAPTVISAGQQVTLIAQNVANPAAVGRRPVILRPAALQFTFNNLQLTTLSYNGQNYLASLGAIDLVSGGLWRSPSGVTTAIPFLSPTSAVSTTGTNYYQHVYNSGQAHQFTVKVAFSRFDGRTLKVDAYITNNDATDSLAEINLCFTPLNLPGPTAGGTPGIGVAVDQLRDTPAGFLTGAWGSIALWQDYPTPGYISAAYNQTTQTMFPFTLSNYVSRVFATPAKPTGGVENYESPIAPGQTQHLTQYLRFGTATDTVSTLAPEAFASFQTAFPNIVNWPDRRPIATWFTAEFTDTSAMNPRGYLYTPILNVSQTSNFQSAMLTQAKSTIARMNTMVPKPQGIILWDLEGQEFVQSMSYIGHPDELPVLAPEMDAIADQVFGLFTGAGYRVGMTIRPQDFGTGTSLPSTCASSTNYVLNDKFVMLNATPPHRGYVCTAQNTWTAAPAGQPYTQASTDSDSAILAELEKKIAYAQARWGATLFYIDSDVWVNGDPIYANVFRALAQQFPNVLLIPETTRPYHYGVSASYQAGANLGVLGTPASARAVYPGAFSVVSIGGISFTPTILGQLAQSVASGDILLFPAWYAAPEVLTTQRIYTAAQALP